APRQRGHLTKSPLEERGARRARRRKLPPPTSPGVLRRPRPRAHHRGGRRRPLGDLHLLGHGRGLRVRTALDGALLVPAHGRRPAHVLAARDGHGPRPRRRDPPPLPPRVLWTACGLLTIANVFNIGADLGGMAEATEMV